MMALPSPEKPDRAAAQWREVSLDELGSDSGAHCVRAPAFVMWEAPGAFLGIFAIAPLTIDDLEDSWRAIGAWNRRRTEPVGFFADARTFRAAGPPGPLMSHMLRGWGPVAESMGGAFSRSAVVLPQDWSRAWWVGAVHVGMPGAASGPVMPRVRIRFETAAAAIVHTDEKIDTIGSSVGFRSRSHFVAWFRQQTGATPAAFRERARAAVAATPGG